MKLNFFHTNISQLYSIKYEKFLDSRGEFSRNFCEEQIQKIHPFWIGGVKQASLSINAKKGTIRGFHYSLNPNEAKLMSCVVGKFFVAVIDLNKSSNTMGKTFTITLDKNITDSILVPPKCATAFQTLEDNSLMQYFMSEKFSELDYKGFRYDQPSDLTWPIEKDITISERDLQENRVVNFF